MKGSGTQKTTPTKFPRWGLVINHIHFHFHYIDFLVDVKKNFINHVKLFLFDVLQLLDENFHKFWIELFTDVFL